MPVDQPSISLLDRVKSIQWWHQIDLCHGIITPGPDNSSVKIAAIHLPDDLTGKTVIDIGAWDGAFSFECDRRNASRSLQRITSFGSA